MKQNKKLRDILFNIHLRPFYREMFGYKPGDFPVTERVASSTIVADKD
jgi:perosamine synthetase